MWLVTICHTLKTLGTLKMNWYDCDDSSTMRGNNLTRLQSTKYCHPTKCTQDALLAFFFSFSPGAPKWAGSATSLLKFSAPPGFRPRNGWQGVNWDTPAVNWGCHETGKVKHWGRNSPEGTEYVHFPWESFLFNGLHPQSSIKNLFKRLKSSTLHPSLSLRQAQEGASEHRQIRHFRCSSHVKNRSNSSFTSGLQ